MFGNNVISKQQADTGTLAVQEVFHTLQGEGPFTGCPAIFVRLAGCNLACTFCDTQFDTGLNNIVPTGALVTQVLQLWDEMSVRYRPEQKGLVVLTGGEPLRQGAVVPLIAGLVEAGCLVQIETAGTLWPEGLEQFFLHNPADLAGPSVVIVCSPKTPEVHPKIKQLCMHWKYVVSAGEVSDEDGLPIRGTQKATWGQVQKLARPPHAPVVVWVSPCDDYNELLNAGNVQQAKDCALKFGYSLSLQVHKLVDLP